MSNIALSSTDTTANILVVDDEPLLADLLSEWVKEKWACTTAYGGKEALELVNDEFDIVLLDRQMPDLSGDEVLESIRESKPSLQVMMVSGVTPDFDILALPFDYYLPKPVDRPTLQEAIEGLIVRRSYHSTIQQFFSATAKIDLLEESKSAAELAEDERYLSLRAKADELRQKSDATLGYVTDYVEKLYETEADD